MVFQYNYQNFSSLVGFAVRDTTFRVKFLDYVNDVIKEHSALRSWAMTRTSLNVRSGREVILAKIDIIQRDLLDCEFAAPTYKSYLVKENEYWKRFHDLVERGLVDEIKSAADTFLKPCKEVCVAQRPILMNAVRQRYAAGA